jgi:hypothetical protein
LAHPDLTAAPNTSPNPDPTQPFAAIESFVVKKIVGDRPDIIADVLALTKSDEGNGDGNDGTKVRRSMSMKRDVSSGRIGGLTEKVKRFVLGGLDSWMGAGKREVGEAGGLVVRGRMGGLKGQFPFSFFLFPEHLVKGVKWVGGV